MTRGRLPWLPPLSAFCPHLLIACLAVNWHLPSILNVAYQQVKMFSSYCMSDFLCSVYGIPLTPNHLPERPDGIFCTVIKPAESSRSLKEETQPGMRRPTQDNGPFASRDYRYYNQGASNQGAEPNFIATVFCSSHVCFDVFYFRKKPFFSS